MGRFPPGEITNKEIIDDLTKYFISPKSPIYLQIPIKSGLKRDKDFKCFKGEAARFLYEIYGGTQILRREIRLKNGDIEIQIYPFILYTTILNNLHDFNKPIKIHPNKYLIVDPNITIEHAKKEIVNNILPSYNISYKNENVRLWKLDPIKTIEEFFAELAQQKISLSKYSRELNSHLFEYNCGIDFPGVSADFYPDAPLAKFFSDSLSLIIETADPEKPEFIFKFIKKVKPGVCPACNIYKTLMISCSCQKIIYCSEECQLKDKINHNQVCMNIGVGNIYIVKKPLAKNGIVGLSNIGNTCYLNSALQCLSNTYELTKYFLEDKFSKDINTVNPLGFKGELAESYAKLIFNMWNNDENTIAPHYIKKTLSKFYSQVFLLG